MRLLKRFFQPDEMGFITLVAAYTVICAVIAYSAGRGDDFHFLLYLRTGMVVTFTLLSGYILYRLVRAGYIIATQFPDKPLLVLYQDLKKGPLRPELYKKALPIFIGFIVFFSVFTSMKMIMPRVFPFSWDVFFMETDKALHLGTDPWRILQPLLGYPVITKLIALIYICWLPLFFIVLYWQMFRLKDQLLRLRFFYTFALAWSVNGTFFAMLFSSAGPCFYKRVLGSNYFQPLMDYLTGVNDASDLYAIKTQDLLWNNYLKTGEIMGGGISAFPSVHVATAFLFLLVGYHVNKWCFAFFAAFFVAILLGSVHLGWHYASDGYFAILTTSILWWISGKLVRKA